MSSQTPDDGTGPGEQQWEQFLRSMLGDDADEAMRQMRERGLDPQALARGAGVGDDPRALEAVLAQVQRVLASSGDSPVNTDVAHDVARQVAVTGGDPVVVASQAKAARDALSVAELWLDVVTDLPPAGGGAKAWSRSEWVEATLPAWGRLVAPVAASVSEALATVLGDQMGELGGLDADASIPGLPPGALGGVLGQIDPASMMRRMGSAVFGMQTGQAAGTLSREVFGATDVGVPLLEEDVTVLVPNNVEAFAEGLDAPLEEVRLFLALREAAHARLFAHVPWLRAHLLGLVEEYARGITIDLETLEERVRSIDVSDTTALQDALSGNVFRGENTDEQKATLVRLETTLALVEGWVDEVTATAALPHLPHAVPLREMVRRRRAAGGPAEQVFSALVALRLRPRRSRDAAALWAHITAASGPAGRDAVWDHPDLLPGTVDLDDPAGYAQRGATARAEEADLDKALEAILAGDTAGIDDAGNQSGGAPGDDRADGPGDGLADGPAGDGPEGPGAR
ncbi:zinc-dependent metalloprotease [Cellulomonas sp. PhB143]|uniref:zinc-dependent metalloprotease n=1 Tax=Cellulomonas sp. PhB143 TaxID=2485186 RepID=UPI000F47E873|nr:zinc-dependent metalloprotease [Cellulomonas sp. PhB143]ROS76868.1 putative hydrolase [Cellulomonas sp. PhB143]